MLLLLLLSRFSCVRLCDPIDGSSPGSSVRGIFQARALEWGAIAFSIELPCYPAILLLRGYSRDTRTCVHTDLYMSVHSRITQSSKKWLKSHMSVN